MKPWKAILAALVIFVAGLASGVMGARLYHGESRRPALPQARGGPPGHGSSQRTDFLRRAQAKLDLTPEQRLKFDKLLDESQQRMRQLWEPVGLQARQEMEKVRKDIEAELNAEQREKFQKLLKEKPGRPPGEWPGRRREGPSEGPPRYRPTNLDRTTPVPAAPPLEAPPPR